MVLDIFKGFFERAEEKFFGENNAVKLKTIQFVKDIRGIINFTGKTDVKKLTSVINEYEAFMCKAFNIETLTIGFLDRLNANCYPMYVNKELGSKDTYHKYIKKADDVKETANGYMYKDGKGIKFIINIGLPLIDERVGFEADEVAAIIMHEYGHAFQQAVFGVKVGLFLAIGGRFKKKAMVPFMFLYNFLDKRSKNKDTLFATMNTILLNAMSEKSTENEIKQAVNGGSSKKGDSFDKIDKTLIKVIEQETKENPELFDRDKLSSSTKTDRKKKMKRNGQYDHKHNTIFSRIAIFIIMSIAQIVTFSMLTLLGAGIITVLFILPHKLAKIFDPYKNTTDTLKSSGSEVFADYFAASYGLGAALTSGLKRLYEQMDHVFKFSGGVADLLGYFPPMGALMYYYELALYHTMNEMAGYPKDLPNRMSISYKTLEKSLKEDKSLSASDKVFIQKEMKRMEKDYKDYINSPYPHRYFGAIMAFITRKTIDKEKNPAFDILSEELEKRSIKAAFDTGSVEDFEISLTDEDVEDVDDSFEDFLQKNDSSMYVSYSQWKSGRTVSK